jgi:hypothetical protein
MFEHIPHEDTTFIYPLPAQLVFGHVTLLNDEEEFLQGLDGGMETSYERYQQPQQMTAHELFTTLLETLSEGENPLAWQLGFILGEMIGLFRLNLDECDQSLSYLEAFAHCCQRRTC